MKKVFVVFRTYRDDVGLLHQSPVAGSLDERVAVNVVNSRMAGRTKVDIGNDVRYHYVSIDRVEQEEGV